MQRRPFALSSLLSDRCREASDARLATSTSSNGKLSSSNQPFSSSLKRFPSYVSTNADRAGQGVNHPKVPGEWLCASNQCSWSPVSQPNGEP